MGPYHNQTSDATLGKSVFTVQTDFKLNDRQMGTQTDRQTDRQTARETDRQTDRQRNLELCLYSIVWYIY